MQSTQHDFLPILMQAGLAIGFVVATIIGSSFLGPKRHSKNKDKNFECGIESVGNARIPFSVKYFLVAILFVLFDVEVIFLYPWAEIYLSFVNDQDSTCRLAGLHFSQEQVH